MPLKIVTVPKSKNLYMRGTIAGQSIFESTGTTDKRIAEEIRRKREAELWNETVYGKRAVITFAEAVTAYLDDKPRSPATHKYLLRLLKHFGERRLTEISQASLKGAYAAILEDGEEATPATKKRAVRTPLQAILEFGAIQGWCDRPAFAPISIQSKPKKFLRPDEATQLVAHAAPHLQPLFVFLIGTGCRLSEALDLEWRDVDLWGARAVVWQKQGNQRHVDMPPCVIDWLKRIEWREGHVFRPVTQTRKGSVIGERYHNSARQYGGQIKNGWAGACRRAGLPGRLREWIPAGQTSLQSCFVPDFTPHDLRHTWASWHYCVHRDLLRLQTDGAWSNINTVTIYAKLMPEAYKDQIERWWRDGPRVENSG
ncbi:integrase [Acetobacter syzygii]|uniref:tyrosine-type recombinase/integrase n=1 Tax=Acetobacter syzygii TaxID=146476 RepID=UPI0005E661B5|nr:tyrosine-type recombinase/integrase [Acetobacter syzygii]GAN72157.1 prophage integrase [Acetobacter syzygii]GBR65012.1 prophage integrase [Acetobacter syzygii NRIC 0483]GEL56378.1 integrase [Acetobacter syzygii]